MKKLTILFFFLFVSSFAKAGCPPSPILAICEIKTTDTCFQGIIYLYKGGYSDLCPNGFFISYCDSSLDEGEFFYFTLLFRKFERFKGKEGRLDSIAFTYAKSLFKERKSSKNYKSFSTFYETGLHFINLAGSDMMYNVHNRNLYDKERNENLLIPSEPTNDRYYRVSSTFEISTSIDTDPQCLFTRPNPSNLFRIPIEKIVSIKLIRNPQKHWLDMIKNCKGNKWYFPSHWYHEIVKSRRSINMFMKTYKDLIIQVKNYTYE